MMTISVIIPTYRRPKDLQRCLEALKRQTRSANQVIVTVRDTDTETWQFLDTFDRASLPLQTVTVTITGVVAAMNAGLDIAQGDIIAFTDDDAAPHIDWLERIEQHFLKDDRLGGLGGRDFVYVNNQLAPQKQKAVVGKIQWFGRHIGEHEFGIGEAREVDVLKGVNMSFRHTAIANLRFDQRMRGTGAQVHFELAFSFALKRLGWKLVYDPQVAVDHYRAERFDEDQRNQFNFLALANQVHNETLCLLEYFPPLQQIVFLLWGALIGSRAHPGLVQCLRFLPKEGYTSVQKLIASLQGQYQGWQSWRQSINVTSTQVQVKH